VTDAEEHVLVGGNVSDVVVRVGDTVRKPGLPQTPAVEAFLSYLNAAGYPAAPRTLGRDERGRHALEYIPGRLAHDMPPMDLRGLYRVGRLIRELHDVAEGFAAPAEAQWDVCIAPDRADLICHHDLAPWNLVCDGDRWVFIDWDGAGPGSRLWDLAWAATGFVPMEPDGNPAADAPRLAALADGYGLTDAQRLEFPPLIGAHSRGMADLLVGSALTGKQPWARLYAEGHADYWGPAADYAEQNVETWTRALR
jgi:Ser/Thr protein kinase RdoA (MazF antagonist)